MPENPFAQSPPTPPRQWNPQLSAQMADAIGMALRFKQSVAFTPDGRTLASASSDGTVRLWGVR